MMFSSVRSFRIRSLSRLAASVVLASIGMGDAAGVASARTPGSESWVARYDGSAHISDLASAAVTSPDGSMVFVTGTARETGRRFDYATLAYDASTGSQVWATLYDGAANLNDSASAIAVSPDGSTVFVTGSSNRSKNSDDYATVAYDASSGAQLWVKRYNGPRRDSDRAIGIGVSPDGAAVFVTGSSSGRTYRYDVATVAYEASAGTQLWVKRYNGPGNAYDEPGAIGVSPDGSSVFVTGYRTRSTGDEDYVTLAYDALSGTQLWIKRYNGPGNGLDEAHALGVSPDGSEVFVTGHSFGAHGYGYATVGYDASTGTEIWTKRYEGPVNKGFDVAKSLGVSPDGSEVFVTGFSNGVDLNHFDYATVAYDTSTGSEIWSKRYNGPVAGDSLANGLGVSPDGSQVLVTGGSAGSGSYDYATVAYDAATGSRAWARRYDGPGNDFDVANALTVSPDGSDVFVTGESAGATGTYDFATVAYSLV